MANDELLRALNTSLINRSIESDLDLQHKLIVNRPKHKVLTTIINELIGCDQFLISVAFITKSGVSLLVNTLKALEERGVKGQILTGDYLNFTDPEALYRLSQFSNVEVKLITEQNFHAKGYFFRKDDNWNIILGSSNLTQAALTKTEEWNIKLSSSNDGSFVNQLLNEYNKLWNQTADLLDVLSNYDNAYLRNKEQSRIKNRLYKEYIENQDNKVDYVPNKMQVDALDGLKRLRESGKNKALIISATGTGKTILSAFDVIEFMPRKMIFIVHRESIARKSMNTYKKMISGKTFGVLTGNQKDFNADYIFATIQTLVNHKEKFKADHFDYMIVDEVHHGGAKTYQEIYDYFTPKFSLGMSATPKRTDGFDIFALYDNNIAFEYKLSEALHQELLAPFHYFGVSDIEIDGELIDDKTAVTKLTTPIRTEHIIEKISFYGHSGETVHGLIFVSNVDEANALSDNLNQRGYKTIALSANDSESVRLQAIEDLESAKLEYIITVDIFNEGIDIPCVNQVILLRPTTSAIVYIQQIGRGLRKTEDKDYVVLIDFIGNYKNNYLIPVAIGNTGTYDKDKLKKDIVLGGVDYLEGETVLQFEEIVQKRLLKQISTTNFSTLANIKSGYNYLKLKYRRVPKLIDFVENELIAPEVILEKSYKNYLEVKSKIENTVNYLSSNQEAYLNYVSQVVFPAKRLHEVYILELLIDADHISISDLNEVINCKFSVSQDDVTHNALLHLSRGIFKSLSDEKKYIPFLVIEDEIIRIDKQFKLALESDEFKSEIIDVLQVCKLLFERECYEPDSLLTIGKLYTRKQAYKYTLHDFNNGYQVSGSTVFDDEGLVFITLDNSSSFGSYDNMFLDNKTLTWFSKSNRRLYKEGVLTAEGKIAHNMIPLKIFVKRNSSENFYYLGEVHNVLDYEETLNKDNKSVVKYKLELDNSVEEELFKYLMLEEEL